jgi:hypothetical protein
MSKSSYPPLLTDEEMELAFREGASDEEIEVKLRHLIFWSYIVRDPFGKVCAVGRGTRAECIENPACRRACDRTLLAARRRGGRNSRP